MAGTFARGGVVVKLNSDGVRALLQGNDMQELLRGYGQQMRDTAGMGFVVDSEVGRTRARVRVSTATVEAMRAEAETRALTRAVSARA